MSSIRRQVALATSACLLAGATWARADDAALLREIQQLRAEQAEMKKEMKELRQELDAKQAKPAAVEEVQRSQSVITEEVRKLKEALVLPESAELKSEYGLGPAASKVYNVTRGVSIGGYGEYNYKSTV